MIMKTKTNVKAGGTFNHNETVARGVKVRSQIKAGALGGNHNETIVRGMKVRSQIKAGLLPAV
jgi:hypothetical protein